MINVVVNQRLYEEADICPSVTLLDYLRDHLRLTGTKEGCGEGDCGACTVIQVRDGQFEAVNACLLQVGQVDGIEILTVEGLEAINNGMPVSIQNTLSAGDGTQCGFCTPGFIMALFALGQTEEEITDELIHDSLAGNLCRCTGYRPIVDAARKMSADNAIYKHVQVEKTFEHAANGQSFFNPLTLESLLELRSQYPDAMLLAGGTDLGLLASKDRKKPEIAIHLGNVKELCEIREDDQRLVIGAGATYKDCIPFFNIHFPAFAKILGRIGSRQIRNLGTLGGNIGTASPIGDTLPCLVSLNSSVTLVSKENGERTMPIEEFLIGFRKTDLNPNEIIRKIEIPKLNSEQEFRAYKISKRFDQDISSVIAAFCISIAGELVTDIHITYGGMAATVRRAKTAEQILKGKAFTEEVASEAANAIKGEFTPISDLRASSEYRELVASNLVHKFYRDIKGLDNDVDLMSL